ncbi:glutathione S-transferase family protein [Candidatus Uabimicrobium sp. HlEnr_7]|uniref:glutathione S-transferase family protein n=1 Tax=Candidatus Uabimicrobium helgolandensis TaxID=3095367 RepID=UPI003555FF85
MIELHQYPGSWGLPSSSPFCIKVETYLLITQIPYKTVWENNPGRGPKGKMPFIKDQKKVIADSSFILEYLQSNYEPNLDLNMDETQKVIMLAFQRLIEESLYWVLLYSRWGDTQGWQEIKKEITPMLPPLIGKAIIHIIRKNLLRQAYAQGMGRHTREEIYSIGKSNIEALAKFLENKPYFFGDKPRSIDCSFYSFLITILQSPVTGPLQDYTKSFVNLREYCARISEKYWQTDGNNC